MCAGLLTVSLSAQTIDQGVFLIGTGTGIGFSSISVTGGTTSGKTTVDGTVVPGTEYDADWKDMYDKQSNSNYDFDFMNFSDWETRFLNGINLGYFVSDGFLVGLGLNISGLGDKEEFTNTAGGGKTRNSSSAMTIIPRVRYYIEAGEGALFFEGSFGMGTSKQLTSSESSSEDLQETISKTFNTTIGVGAGYSIFLGDAFAIEPILNIGIISEKNSNESTTEVSGIKSVTTSEDKLSKFAINFGIGMSFYLEP